MTRHNRILLTVLALGITMLTSLVMMSEATQNSAIFGRIYSLLLVVNAVGLLSFLVLIGINIRQLVRDLRRQRPGARLKRRMTVMFVVIAVIPVMIVYSFSLDVLRRGFDSWFDVRVEKALNDSLDLSRAALDLRMRELMKQTVQVAQSISDNNYDNSVSPLNLDQLRMPESTIVANDLGSQSINLDDLRHSSGAEELTLLSSKGTILATSSMTNELVPNLPSETIMLQLRQHQNYIGLDPIKNRGLFIRVVVAVPSVNVGVEPHLLQAIYPITDRMTNLADNVQVAFAKYRELSYLRDQLKISFTMTLTLVLLFSLFGAVWAAFYSAARLAAPIRDLAEGTRAVAAGNYETILPVSSKDEMGVLVQSFNDMTRRISAARAEVEAQRTYLETVLGRLSSGVLTVDHELRLRTANAAASQILGTMLDGRSGDTLAALEAGRPHLQPLLDTIAVRVSSGDWQAQVTLFGPSGRKVLMCRGAPLSGGSAGDGGHVIVFDDVTALIQGQRDAAWSEVARRLAHEIKNPLTPIQLSAERLRHKYLRSMDAAEADTLDRLTNTIIQQVETMKGMVNTFSEYARSPRMQQERIDLNQLIEEVVELYRTDDGRIIMDLELDRRVPLLFADPNRLRQLLNNLVKNAIEAQSDKPSCLVRINTRLAQENQGDYLEMRIEDRGHGIPMDMLSQVFEPYVTNKSKGTGLGLPIVKKIAEEHGGIVWMENNVAGGATAVIRLPVAEVESGNVAIGAARRPA